MKYGRDHIALVAEEDQPYRYSTNYLRLSKQHQMAYVDIGHGQPIIMIHGLGGYIKHWYPTIESLSNSFRCIAVDLPGYGASSVGLLSENDILDAYAVALDELCKHLRLDKVIILGHSMGAQVALIAASKKPSWLSKLILAAPAGFETFNKKEAELLQILTTTKAFQSQTEEQIRIAFEMNFTIQSHWTEELIQDRLAMIESPNFLTFCKVRSEGVKGMLDHPVRAGLSEIDIPTLILFGSDDQLIPNQILHPELTVLAVAEAYNEMPNAESKLIEGAGHMLQLDQSKEFNTRVEEFSKSSIYKV